MSVTAQTPAIRLFRIEVPEERLAELRRRLVAVRWPSGELVADRSQGVQLATVRALGRFWAAEHDWRKTEAKRRIPTTPLNDTARRGRQGGLVPTRGPGR
jgi:hypothetical protein